MKLPESKGRGMGFMYGLCLVLALVCMIGITTAAYAVAGSLEPDATDTGDAAKYYVSVASTPASTQEQPPAQASEPAVTEPAETEPPAEETGDPDVPEQPAEEPEDGDGETVQAKPPTGEPGLWD